MDCKDQGLPPVYPEYRVDMMEVPEKQLGAECGVIIPINRLVGVKMEDAIVRLFYVEDHKLIGSRFTPGWMVRHVRTDGTLGGVQSIHNCFVRHYIGPGRASIVITGLDRTRGPRRKAKPSVSPPL